MEVLNPRSALLSNYEVLNLLRELESDHIARSKTAVRIKKEEESAGISSPAKGGGDPTLNDTSENLRTIEVEAIQYLAADYQPTVRQSQASITRLVQDLAPFEFTKAEKLQIVNLAPTEDVELYVIVEELEDRLGDRMEEVLTHVRSSLSEVAPAPTPATLENARTDQNYNQEQDTGWDETEVYGTNDIDFDDVGEGAGIEGDLDVDDD